MADRRLVAPVLERVRGSGLDSSNGTDFVRLRIALFGQIVALIAGAFYVIGIALNAGLGLLSLAATVGNRESMFHLLAIAIAAAMWMVCRYGRFSMVVLGVIDAVGFVGCCAAFAGMLAPGRVEAMQPVLLALTLTVTARAIVVPSKPARTLRLTLLGFLPTLALVWWWAAALQPPPELPADRARLAIAIGEYLWAAAATALAMITSRVIYGLRQSVREANELGQYTLQDKLGEGGMGEVWRAHHRLLVRAAAIKLIRPEPLLIGNTAPEVLLRRFEREARATAALRSPHTVQLYDFGQAEDGTLYYVMEMLVGLDLDHLISRFGPVPAERAIHILRHVCSSLEEAHQNGLIHRDIKPANIFVSHVASEGDFAKVLDFGLVRVHAERRGIDQLKLTAEGATSGTPAFMAPEIVLDQPYDHRVDLYAVGCVAYWLLTGKLVFEGGSPVKVMLDHAQAPPPPPHTRTELAIPPELEQVVMDCLEKTRELRPASAAELARRLAECPTPQAWSCERAERWWHTHLPEHSTARPVAEVLLSHEGSAPAKGRELRPRPRRVGPG
ncbi:MAG TPA: serine/threonine-protein kinase [Kofleriaceae bacterium]